MRSLKTTLVVGSALVMAGCSTSANLAYNSSHTIVKRAMPSVVKAVETQDHRPESPHRLATIMGGFGNPLKIINTEKPVSQEVSDVFTSALLDRGIPVNLTGGKLVVMVSINRLDGDQLLMRQGRAVMDVDVIQAVGGRVLYHRHVSRQQAEPRFVSGIFASSADLRAIVNAVLNQAVDEVLDDAAFIQVLQHTSSPTS